ncbi:unnamed protein product, partial [Onchocerca ochengi]
KELTLCNLICGLAGLEIDSCYYNSGSLSRHVLIRTMTEVCLYCKAQEFNGKTKGMCCVAGKIKLPQLEEPLEPLKTLLDGYTNESKRQEIQPVFPNGVVRCRNRNVMTKNTIHGTCGKLNPNSPCMIDGKCCMRYPRALISNTVTRNDGILYTEDQQKMATGRYVNSNELVRRILSFSLHERSPAVLHLAVHLENGQRVYFTVANMQQIAPNPSDFFTLRQTDAFAKLLLYSEVLHTYYT